MQVHVHVHVGAYLLDHMLCTAIAVRTCSTWYGVIADDTGVSSMKYSIGEYFNGWLADADDSSNAGPASAQRSQF